MSFVLAIDQGTTGSTALVIDNALQVRGRCNLEFPQLFPQPGWVEHNPEDIWKSVCEAVDRAIAAAKIDSRDINAIGITNQRETTLLWERATLTPARTAIVWQDRRTAEICQTLKAAGHEPMVRERTGLVLDPYFSATKLRWMLDDDPQLARRARSGELAFGTVDSYLVAKLTGGAKHVTDVTNASRTLLSNIDSLTWDSDLIELFGIPSELLPEIRPSSEIYGHTRGVPGIPDGIPIAGIAGDQQAALFGQECIHPGDAKCTFGTGAFVLMNTGDSPMRSRHGLLTTVAWQIGNDAPRYALEGSAFIAGAAVQWLRDGLGIIDAAADIETLAKEVDDSGGVVFVPGFAGLGAPHWRPDARGAILGMTRGTTSSHIARACLEGIALQNYDILQAMEKDCGESLVSLKVDGGAAANDLLMQLQADILGVDLIRPHSVETTAIGAAMLAGLATGLWQTIDAITATTQNQRTFTPHGQTAAIDNLITRWHRAIDAA